MTRDDWVDILTGGDFSLLGRLLKSRKNKENNNNKENMANTYSDRERKGWEIQQRHKNAEREKQDWIARDREYRAMQDAIRTRGGYSSYRPSEEDEDTRFWREHDATYKEPPVDNRTYTKRIYEDQTIPGRGEKGGPENEYEYDQEPMYGDDYIKKYSNEELEAQEGQGTWSDYKNKKYDYVRNNIKMLEGVEEEPSAQEIADAIDMPTEGSEERNIPLGKKKKNTSTRKKPSTNEKDLVYQRYQRATGNKWKDVKNDKRFSDLYNDGDYDGNIAVGRRADRMISGEYIDRDEISSHIRSGNNYSSNDPGDYSGINIPQRGQSTEKKSTKDKINELKDRIASRRKQRALRREDQRQRRTEE